MAGQGLLAAVSLVVVVLLILAGARAAKWVPALRRATPAGKAPVLLGSLVLDGRRRLHLVQAGTSQVLLLTGGASDVMLGLPPAPGA